MAEQIRPNHSGDSLAGTARSVTKSDTDDVPGGLCNGLYIGTGGDLKVEFADGQVVLFKNYPQGFFPGRVKRVANTDTTAADIVALY